MAEIDKLKEEIGWLKVVFGLLIAIDVSLVGWAAQNVFKAQALVPLFALAIVMLLLVTWVIILINHRAYKKIKQLGDL